MHEEIHNHFYPIFFVDLSKQETRTFFCDINLCHNPFQRIVIEYTSTYIHNVIPKMCCYTPTNLLDEGDDRQQPRGEETTKNGVHRPPRDENEETSSSTSTSPTPIIGYTNLRSFLLVTMASLASLKFSTWFPFVLPLGVADASSKTYIPAYYHYDGMNTKFDNTIYTYGTDYLLTIIMFTMAHHCYYHGNSDDDTDISSHRLRLYTTSLLVCYGLSTLAGGYSHQYYIGITALNTNKFRILWTITVGNVAFASCFMGLIGREVQLLFAATAAAAGGGGDAGDAGSSHTRRTTAAAATTTITTTSAATSSNRQLLSQLLPVGPIWFWPVYGTYMLLACALGYMSYKRPACDIFIAGITQFPTTAYCLLVLGLCCTTTTTSSSSSKCGGSSSSTPMDHVRLPYKIMFYIGFAGNAPLLPMYPILVQHTTLSLATINTLLHTNLLCMWGMQGLSVLHLIKAIGLHEKEKKKLTKTR